MLYAAVAIDAVAVVDVAMWALGENDVAVRAATVASVVKAQNTNILKR